MLSRGAFAQSLYTRLCNRCSTSVPGTRNTAEPQVGGARRGGGAGGRAGRGRARGRRPRGRRVRAGCHQYMYTRVGVGHGARGGATCRATSCPRPPSRAPSGAHIPHACTRWNEYAWGPCWDSIASHAMWDNVLVGANHIACGGLRLEWNPLAIRCSNKAFGTLVMSRRVSAPPCFLAAHRRTKIFYWQD